MTTPTLTISFATAADYDEWLPHWRAYQRFYKSELSDEVTRNTWARFLDPSARMYCLIARLAAPVGAEAGTASTSSVVGFAHFLFHQSTWNVRDYCYLEDLFVDPSCRGQQVGRRLIERLYWEAMGVVIAENSADSNAGGAAAPSFPKRAFTDEAARVHWHTQEHNHTAQRLYNWVATKTEFIQYCKLAQ